VHLTAAEIASWVGSFIWPLVRIGAMAMTAPLYSARSVPARVRLGLALGVTMVVAPLLPAAPAVDPFSAAALMILVQQLIIGVAMGFALQLVFSAVVTGGHVVAMQMGLGFASLVDPQNGTQVPVVSQVYLMMMTLVFLALNGHLALIDVLVESFRTMPISTTGLAPQGLWQVVAWGSQLFAGAVSLALPAIASLLIVNLAFGVMTRAAPQLNIFAIGFPLTMLFGFVVMIMTLPSAVPQTSHLWFATFDMLRRITGGGG